MDIGNSLKHKIWNHLHKFKWDEVGVKVEETTNHYVKMIIKDEIFRTIGAVYNLRTNITIQGSKWI